MLVGELIEEEQLSVALKASKDIALEERATRVASFIYDRAPGNLLILYVLFPLIVRRYSNICIFFHNARDLLTGKTSVSTEIPDEAVESFVLVLEAMVAEKVTKSSIFAPEVIAPEKEIEPPVQVSDAVTLG